MKIRYTKKAAKELADILDYIAEHSPTGSRRVQTRIQTVLRFLMEFPFAGQQTDIPGLRRLVVTPFPYLIFYQIADKELIIVAVRHGSQERKAFEGEQT